MKYENKKEVDRLCKQIQEVEGIISELEGSVTIRVDKATYNTNVAVSDYFPDICQRFLSEVSVAFTRKAELLHNELNKL